MSAKLKEEILAEPKLIKLDIGCGTNKYKGPKGDATDWVGLDCVKFDGVDHIFNIGRERWPFADNSVEEGYSSHFVEHLTAFERIHFANELCRVLIPKGKCKLIFPYWGADRAYGDPTHQWPPMSPFWFNYLSREWRLDQKNAPHTDAKYWKGAIDGQFDPGGFTCDFESTPAWGVGMHPLLASRNQEFQQFAMAWYKEAVQDIHVTLVKR